MNKADQWLNVFLFTVDKRNVRLNAGQTTIFSRTECVAINSIDNLKLFQLIKPGTR